LRFSTASFQLQLNRNGSLFDVLDSKALAVAIRPLEAGAAVSLVHRIQRRGMLGPLKADDGDIRARVKHFLRGG
jgi:hypothetical protein